MKPIAVLLLVLVAVGALIFGLVTLGGSKESNQTSPVNPDAPKVAPKESGKAAELEKGGEAPRREDPVVAEADRAPEGEFVYANELRVLIVDNARKPISGADVTLTSLSSGDLFFADSANTAYQVGPLRTGADGRVSFMGIQPNNMSYTLVCTHPEYARLETATLPIEQDGVFEEPPIVMNQGGTLQGSVKDEQGGPIAGARLVLEGPIAAVQQSRAPDRIEVLSDASGVYTIKNIPMRGPARKLSISAPGFGRVITQGQNFPDMRPRTYDFVLRVAEMINGRVVGPGNQPLAKAKVLAIGLNQTQHTARDDQETNEQGEFQFESLVPGEYNVITTLRGWRFTPQNRVHTNTANLVFEGKPMASVSGQVLDEKTGAPITSFSAQLRDFSDIAAPTTPRPGTKASFSDSSGKFTLTGVEQGNYVVEAWANGYAPTRSGNFTISNDRNQENIVIRLTQGGSISGRLLDAASKPIAKALIRTKPNDWGEDEFSKSLEDMYPSNVTQTETRSGADGSFSLKGLAPDQYQVLFDASGFTRLAKLDVSVTEGTNNNIGELQLAHGGTLAGTVFDASGQGVLGAGIQVYSADNSGAPRMYQTKSGADGKFVLRHIAAGRYKARPSPPPGANANPLENLRIGGDAERSITIADDQESQLDLTLPVSPPAPLQPPVEEIPAKLPPPGGEGARHPDKK
jgi:protocatechuate 3,4-dioxygenase beta subunit